MLAALNLLHSIPLPQIPDGCSPLAFYLCFCAAVFITGLAKGGFGGGIGVIAVPLLVVAKLSPAEALGVMLPLLILGDVCSYYHHHDNVSRKHLGPLLCGAVIGVLAAVVFIVVLGFTGTLNQWLNLVTGGFCLLLVMAQVYRMTGARLPNIPGTPAAGVSVGVLAGFVSSLAHSAGPVINIYLLEQGLDKRRQVGTAVLYFFVGNSVKAICFLAIPLIPLLIPALHVQPLLTWDMFLRSLIFWPLIPAGTLAGFLLHQRVPDKPFTIIMYVATALAAGHMLYKGLSTTRPLAH